jgi:hypothetical protein
MATTVVKHYLTTVNGFYSGSVRGNWAAVEEDAYKNAKAQIFHDLCNDPQSAFVQVDGESKKIQDHGRKCWYNGNHPEKVISEHAHTDFTKFPQHKFKSWQGNRTIEFDFEIEITPI